MKIKVHPCQLSGNLKIQPSKSELIRLLFCAAIAKGESEISGVCDSLDVADAITALSNMGLAKISKDGNKYIVSPLTPSTEKCVIHLIGSGTVLRFVMCLAPIFFTEIDIYASSALLTRPQDELLKSLSANGVISEVFENRISMRGKLTAGDFFIRGDISSQYISGLLLALPCLSKNSRIILTSVLGSSGYVSLTQKLQTEFGVNTSSAIFSDGLGYECFEILGGQKYIAKDISATLDYTHASMYLALIKNGSNIRILNSAESFQPDYKIIELLKNETDAVDISDNPDLAFALVLRFMHQKGKTRKLINCNRLMHKESDRIASIKCLLDSLNVPCVVTPAQTTTTTTTTTTTNSDGANSSCVTTSKEIAITGSDVCGKEIKTFNDHRVAMTAILSSTMANSPIIIDDVSCILKSSPNFLTEFVNLGGKFEIVNS